MSDDSSPAPDTIGEALRAVQAHFEGEDDPVLADLCDLVNRAAEEHARTPDRTPPLFQAIAAEHARQEAEQGLPVSRAEVVQALIWSGLLREAERRVAEKEERIAALRPAADLGPGIGGAPIRVRPTAAPAGLAEVVAASAREPHADVVLQALHVSGGAAAIGVESPVPPPCPICSQPHPLALRCWPETPREP